MGGWIDRTVCEIYYKNKHHLQPSMLYRQLIGEIRLRLLVQPILGDDVTSLTSASLVIADRWMGYLSLL